MEVRILHKFHDKADFNKVYLVGETVTFDDARAEYLVGLGLVEKVVEEAAAVESPAPKKRKATEAAEETDTAVEAAVEATPAVTSETEEKAAARRRTAKNN